MQNRDFIQLHLIYKLAPGIGAVAFLFCSAFIPFLPDFLSVFFVISALLFFVFLVLGYRIESKRQKEIHQVDLDERKASIEATRAKTQLLFVQPQSVTSHKEIDLHVAVNQTVNGYNKSDWEYIIHRILTVGYTKELWLGRVTLPSGKTFATFDTYKEMLEPFIVGGAFLNREERKKGDLVITDPTTLLAMALAPLSSPDDILRLNLVK